VVEDRIVKLRKELTDAGLDNGPETIWWHLQQAGDVTVPSVSTIWRILVAGGFITPDSSKSPNKVWKRFVADQPNELWQIDATHIELANSAEVDIVNIIDDHSRVCVASVAIDSSTTGPDAWKAVVSAAHQWGLPATVLSDNGAPFTSNLFTTNLATLDIGHKRSSPYHPQTCGKVERFHQTLKKRLASRSAPATVAELQNELDTFCDIYNTKRPHRSIGRNTPKTVFDATPKAVPQTRSVLDITTVHHNRVDPRGTIGITGPYAIALGIRYTGQTATTIRTGNKAHVFIDNQLIRELDIDTTRRTQPLKQRKNTTT